MSKAFIHESALSRNKNFEFIQVQHQPPSSWSESRCPADGVIKDFSGVLLRLESTNHCNFSCTFCPHPTMERQKGFMTESAVFRILDEAAQLGFKMLDLRNFGEPIMDKRLPEFAKYARNVGFDKIYIHTNGHLLNSERINAWGRNGITEVNLSLSPKREFSETRPGIPVEKYFANLEKLVSDKPEYLHILNVDYIRTGLSSAEEEAEFNTWLEKIGIQKRIDIELHNWAVGEDKTHFQCHRLWSSITVLWSGHISLCCLDYEGDYNLGFLGDGSESKLSDIVNSDLYIKIRKKHLNGEFLEKCASCDMPANKDHAVLDL